MLYAPMLMLFLTLPGLAQAPTLTLEVEDKRIEQLNLAKDWGTLADLFETWSPQQRKGRYEAWLDALARSRRWARLLEVSEDLARQGKGAVNPSFLAPFKGRALAGLGRHAEALAWFLASGKPPETLSYLYASQEAVALSDWASLLVCGEGLLAKQPGNGDYLGMKGEALTKLGRFQEAAAVLSEAVRLAPKRAMSWVDLACCYNEQALYGQAHEAAVQAVTLEPRLMEGWCNRGRASIGLKRYQEGRDEYAAALALKPADPAVVQNLKQNIAATDKYLAYQRATPAKRPAGKR